MIVYLIPIINLLAIVTLLILFLLKSKAIDKRLDEFESQVKSKIGSIIKGYNTCKI